MQEQTAAAVGIDIGTTAIRCAIGQIKDDQVVHLIGIGEAPNTGFRKGTVININDAAAALDQAIANAERMAGLQVGAATINVNGSHIKGLDSKGTVAVSGHEVVEEDLLRAEDAATVLQLPSSHEILSVFPRSYTVDGNPNIKDPLGMHGTRLEVDAHVVTISGPALKNLEKVVETTRTHINRLSVSSLAAAQATLSREQRENGVAVLDIGATTTNIMVVEEGDVQTVAVVPIGGMHITNDLAVGLRTEIEVAEVVKRNYKYLGEEPKKRPKHIKVVHNGKEYIFPTKDINIIVKARLEELFEDVDKAIGSISRSHRRLPAGITLVGGSANLTGIDVIAKRSFERSARIAYPKNIGGLKEKVARPEYAAAVGLMLLDVHKDESSPFGGRFFGGKFQLGAKQASSIVKRLFDRFK